MKPLPILLAFLAGPAVIQAHAAAVIYESFSQDFSSDPNLDGKAGGTGFNSWSDSQTVEGESESLSYGSLQHTGGQVRISNGPGTDAWVTTTTALKDATVDPNGLLANGETLWMSFMWSKASNGGSNEWSGLGFGTDRVDASFSGINMTNSGNGLGIATRGNALNASTWEGGGNASQGSGISYTLGDSVFVVAKFDWGATVGDVDTITLYTPSLSDLGTLGPSVSKTTSAGVDQTAFDTFSVSLRNSGGDTIIDEIRFGAEYADVAPAVPEPSLALLGGLGSLALLRRRR